MNDAQFSEMWIRNKGTDGNPKFVIVESRRKRGVKSPKQKIICYLGKHPDLDAVIKIYGLMAKDAGREYRRARNDKEPEPKSELLKEYAGKMSFKEIRRRLNKFRRLKVRIEENNNAKEFIAIKKKTVHRGRQSRSLKMRMKLADLSAMICKARACGEIKGWNDDVRRHLKVLLREAVKLEREL